MADSFERSAAVLTDEFEQFALDIHALLPRALAIKALERYAEAAQLDTETAHAYADTLRSMSPKKQEKQRRSLVAVAKLLESLKTEATFEQPLLDAPVEQQDVVPDHHDEQAFVGDGMSAQVTELTSASAETQPPLQDNTTAVVQADELQPSEESDTALNELDTQPDEHGLVLAEQTLTPSTQLHETTELDLGNDTMEDSKKGDGDIAESDLTWAKSIVGDGIELDGMSTLELATLIHKSAGSPRVYKKAGIVPFDPIVRIQHRLEGLTNAQIAARQETTTTRVGSWFKMLKDKATEKPTETPTEPSAADVPEPELKLVPTNERSLEEEPMHVQLSEKLADVLIFDSAKKAALRSMLDPNNNGEMTPAKIAIANEIREAVAESDAAKDLVATMEAHQRVRIEALLAMDVHCKPDEKRQPVQLAGQIMQLRRTNPSMNKQEITNSLHDGLQKVVEVLNAENPPKILQVRDFDGEFRLA